MHRPSSTSSFKLFPVVASGLQNVKVKNYSFNNFVESTNKIYHHLLISCKMPIKLTLIWEVGQHKNLAVKNLGTVNMDCMRHLSKIGFTRSAHTSRGCVSTQVASHNRNFVRDSSLFLTDITCTLQSWFPSFGRRGKATHQPKHVVTITFPPILQHSKAKVGVASTKKRWGLIRLIL